MMPQPRQEGPHLDVIPQELKELPQWVLWDWEKIGDKWTKVPKKLGGGNAASDNPSEWSAFDDVADCERIGFMFTTDDPYCGIDLDDCISEQGELSADAKKIIDAFDSYAEVSPSGTGVKLWTRGSVPGPRRKNTKRGMEMYHASRFFTVTGRKVSDAVEITDSQEQIDKLYGWLFADEPEDHGPAAETGAVDATDADILSKAFRAENSGKFLKLWNGETSDYPSGSEADLALATMLAFWTGPDEGRIERMFSDSVLGQREKWQKRTGYRRATVARALKGKTEFYDWHTGGGATLTITGHIQEEPRISEKAESYEVPPFPVEAMPAAAQRFIEEATEAIGCPMDLVAIPALGVLATGVGGSRSIEVKRSWRENASLFLSVVASPGEKKTPAANVARKPVLKRQAEKRQEYKAKKDEHDREMRQYKADCQSARKDGVTEPPPPQEPIMERVYADDTTVESLVGLLEENPRGLLVFKDELTGWVRSMDQYKAGGKGADRQHWLSMWSGSPVVVDRKSRQGDPIYVERPWITLFGGIQPAMLPELGGAAEDGLLDRFLFAYPQRAVSEFSDAEISVDGEHEYTQLYNKLAALQMAEDEYGEKSPRLVSMSAEATRLFRAYHDEMGREAMQPGFPARLQGVWAKMQGYTARIALIFAMCRHVENGDPEHVEAEDMEAATTVISYFKAHTRKVYGGLGASTPEDLLAADLREVVEEHGGEWEGEPAELFEELNDCGARGMPQSADWMSRVVKNITKHSGALEVDGRNKKIEGKSRRYLKLRLLKMASTASTVTDEADNYTESAVDSGKNVASTTMDSPAPVDAKDSEVSTAESPQPSGDSDVVDAVDAKNTEDNLSEKSEKF